MTVIIPARALIVEQEMNALYEEIRKASNKLTYCYNMTNTEFLTMVSLIAERRDKVNIVRAEMRALLAEAK